MEYKWFESLDEISEHNNEESCHVVYDSMVFDITGTLSELNFVSIEDCGKEITLSEEEWMAFYDVNIGGYLGGILTEDDWVTEDGEEVFITQLDDTATESIQEEPSPLVETETVAIVGVGLLIVVVVIAIIFSSFKKDKKDK